MNNQNAPMTTDVEKTEFLLLRLEAAANAASAYARVTRRLVKEGRAATRDVRPFMVAQRAANTALTKARDAIPGVAARTTGPTSWDRLLQDDDDCESRSVE